MPNIITREDHKYKHFNQSMGIKIESRKHYESEMKSRGYIPKEQADAIARNVREKEHRKPQLTREANQLIKSITGGGSSWKSGAKVQLSGRQIEGMKKMGMCFDGNKIKEMTK